MKAVLVGTDLMYRKDGSLAPIEINTNVGWDEANRVEKEEDVWNLEDLVNFIISKAITEVDFLPGTATRIMSKLQEYDYASATSIALVMLFIAFIILFINAVLQSRTSKIVSGIS